LTSIDTDINRETTDYSINTLTITQQSATVQVIAGVTTVAFHGCRRRLCGFLARRTALWTFYNIDNNKQVKRTYWKTGWNVHVLRKSLRPVCLLSVSVLK